MTPALAESVYRSQPEEHAFAVTSVEGEITARAFGHVPPYRPRAVRSGDAVLNFFDAHALVAGLTFRDGKASFRSRFVRSPLYLDETANKAMRKRRVFTNLPARWSNLFALDFGNNAMHDVYAWGGKVVAGFDSGHFALGAGAAARRCSLARDGRGAAPTRSVTVRGRISRHQRLRRR